MYRRRPKSCAVLGAPEKKLSERTTLFTKFKISTLSRNDAKDSGLDKVFLAGRDVGGAADASSWLSCIHGRQHDAGLADSLTRTVFGAFALQAIVSRVDDTSSTSDVPQ